MSAGDAYTLVNGNANYQIATNGTVRFSLTDSGSLYTYGATYLNSGTTFMSTVSCTTLTTAGNSTCNGTTTCNTLNVTGFATIQSYQSSTQTYRFLSYNGEGGPGTYTMNYSLICNYSIAALEIDAFSDICIKTNVSNVTSCLVKTQQLCPVTFNYINKNKNGVALRFGLIAQEVSTVFPEIVKYSQGSIDNINT